MQWPTCMMTSRTRAGPWGKSSAAGHRECTGIDSIYLSKVYTIYGTGNSKRVLRRSVSLLCGKTDRLHALIFATQRVGVFMSESDGCIIATCIERATVLRANIIRVTREKQVKACLATHD